MKARVVLFSMLFASGCVHRTVPSGFPVQQKTQGAFNPAKDDKRIVQLESRLKTNPQDSAARLELAAIYEGYDLYENAFDEYAQVQTEQAVSGLGRSALQSGRAGEAIAILEKYSKQAPSVAVWRELASLYEQGANLPAAETALRQAVALKSESDGLHNNLGYNLLLQKKLEPAEAEFRRALELNASSATAHNNLGIVLARRGNVVAALEQFELVSDSATAHNNLAVVLLEMGKYEQSREELVKALTIRQFFAPALANFKLVQELIHSRKDPEK